MGVWGSIAKGIVGALPIVGPIIQGGIEAVTAKKASDQQVKGGERAMAVQDQVYNDQKRLMDPYYQTGTAAFTTLGSLLGLPSGGGGGAGQLPASNTLGQQFDHAITPGQANFAGYSPQGGYLGKDMPMSEQMSNRYANQDPDGYTAQQHGAATTSSYGSGAPAASGGMMQVKAPNGQVYQVPADKVAEATQNGGTVVGRV